MSDIDTAAVDSLKVLDLKWPIREADIGKTFGRYEKNGPKSGSLLRAAERNQNANYEAQVLGTLQVRVILFRKSKRHTGEPEPPIEAVRINAPLGTGGLEARAMMLAREVDRCREQLLTKTMAAMLR